MANRFTLREIIPDMHQIVMQLSQAVANSGIDKLHQELIKIRASQINGCAYCLPRLRSTLPVREQVAENVKMLLDAGVVGINIEDELRNRR